MQPGQWKTLHFWLMVLSSLVFVANESPIAKFLPLPPWAHAVAATVAGIAALFGYQIGARWTASSSAPTVLQVPPAGGPPK